MSAGRLLSFRGAFSVISDGRCVFVVIPRGVTGSEE